jgi:predicted Zn-dependent protease
MADVHGDIGVATVQSSTPAPERDIEKIRALIAETPGTYMADMLADLDGKLVRWPDRRQEGLRIWVQASTTVPNWDTRYAQMARDAFDDWGRDSELPIRFDFILDSASSDIRIVWSDRFPASVGQRVGVTHRTADQHGWLTNAEIEVAIHDSTGHTIPPTALVGIVRHEAGHALGMGHSNDQRTKMYPTEMRPDITSSDRSTLRLLYQLPPGLAK